LHLEPNDKQMLFSSSLAEVKKPECLFLASFSCLV
jgi:hypothetical protein